MSVKSARSSARSGAPTKPDKVLDLIEALSAANKDTRKRGRAFKELLRMAKAHPQDLLPYWPRIAKLLKGGNAFSRYPAVFLIAALVPADGGRRFGRTFAAFFALLDDENISVAAHTADLAGGIASAVPEFEPRITRRLLGVEATHFPKGRKDLLKAYAIRAFDRYFPRTKSKKAILTFVRGQLDSTSPKARKAAKDFLAKWGA